MLRRLGLSSLILMEWLLLHLSAVVEGNLLLNCQSAVILLSLSIFIYIQQWCACSGSVLWEWQTLVFSPWSTFIHLIIWAIFFCSFPDFSSSFLITNEQNCKDTKEATSTLCSVLSNFPSLSGVCLSHILSFNELILHDLPGAPKYQAPFKERN